MRHAERDGGMWIGELATRAGVSPDTVRYYEKIGVLPEPERSSGGYRIYGDEAVERLAFIDQAQGLGLSLEEIADIQAMIDRGVEPCEHVRDRLRENLSDVERRIAELERLRSRLGSALAWVEETSADGGCRCRIIENAPGAVKPRREPGEERTA